MQTTTTHGQQQPAPEQAQALTCLLLLRNNSAPPRYFDFPDALGGYSDGSFFDRLHGNRQGTTWFGYESRHDELGRKWRRNYNAVVDDFGTLVEVPA